MLCPRFASLALLSLGLGCASRATSSAKFDAHGPACDAHQRELVAFVTRLPEQAASSNVPVDLPEAALGEVPAAGPLLALSEDRAALDGEPLAGASHAERARALGERFQANHSAAAARVTLSIAASASVDVQTVRTYVSALPEATPLRLLVRMPAPPSLRVGRDSARERALAALAERDPAARSRILSDAYADFSRCVGVRDVVRELNGVSARDRWPRLRSGLLAALPRCDCSELDSESLEPLLIAEQQADAATLGALPFSFVRDARCGASMPLRSLAKLVAQIEQFDQEFAGRFENDTVRFETVITDERLLNTFCNALPGETLAALARQRATLYWKLPNTETCEAWQFEPLSPGAPMGTGRRVSPPADAPTLAFHYWQAAEEIRLFGPADTGSKPTDQREWSCDQNQRLTDVDAHSIALEHGRWFFTREACEKASANDAVGGCSATRTSEEPPQ